MVFVKNSDCIGSDDLLERELDGGLEVHMLVELGVFDELDEHLCVGLGFEGVALLLQTGFEDRVVLNDAIMNDRQPLGLGVMRMGIDRIGFAMRRPAGVRDTYGSAGVLVRRISLQLGDFAFRLIDIQFSLLVDERHAGAVITAILKTMKSFDQNRVRRAATYISYNSAHWI